MDDSLPSDEQETALVTFKKKRAVAHRRGSSENAKRGLAVASDVHSRRTITSGCGGGGDGGNVAVVDGAPANCPAAAEAKISAGASSSQSGDTNHNHLLRCHVRSS